MIYKRDNTLLKIHRWILRSVRLTEGRNLDIKKIWRLWEMSQSELREWKLEKKGILSRLLVMPEVRIGVAN